MGMVADRQPACDVHPVVQPRLLCLGRDFLAVPSLTADLYGRRWATTNYGIVYTAKGTASIFAAPVAAYVMVKTGSWIPVFYVMIACDIVAAFMALLWLKPVATRAIAKAEATAVSAASAQAPKTKEATDEKHPTGISR